MELPHQAASRSSQYLSVQVIVSRVLTRRGWLTGHAKNPPGLHLMLNLTHEPVVGEYLAHLAASPQDAARSGGALTAVD